jgi:hypothetical protein
LGALQKRNKRPFLPPIVIYQVDELFFQFEIHNVTTDCRNCRIQALSRPGLLYLHIRQRV